ncbi:MAG: hypothetical protein U5J78_02640 [Parasphingorhabdus sp.]|nr:hypothetical protein [Parasphingorhabdus sp.]
MTTANTLPPFEKLVLDPAAHFATPADVLNVTTLDDSEKRRVLESWREDEEALQRASDEAMTGGEHSRLKSVMDTLERLNRN